ncbi:MAG: DUF3667 domain-containing protein [Cellulophaga sp.]
MIENQIHHFPCKNCNRKLLKENKFCGSCGAKVIKHRISIKNLIADLFQNAFGWDNKFLVTVKTLICQPQLILSEYINGTRKKYVNPFTFFAIGMAISLFILSTFSEAFLEVSKENSISQTESTAKMMKTFMGEKFDTATYIKDTVKSTAEIQKYILKYYNLYSFLLLPVYTFLAFLVYRKPHNYGEHLIINAYIQGFSLLSLSFIFGISILVHPMLFNLNILLLFFYYLYAYRKLYKHSFWRSVLKILKFLGLLILAFIIFCVLGIIITLTFKFLS